MSIHRLTETLHMLGVGNPALRLFARYDTGSSFSLPCAGVQALPLWSALRQAVVATGYWPLILGDAAALADHRARLADSLAWSETSDIPIIRDLQIVHTTDAVSWFQTHTQRLGHHDRAEPPIDAQPRRSLPSPSDPSLRLATDPYAPEADTMTISTTITAPSFDQPDGQHALVPTPTVFLGLFPAHAAWQLPLYLQYGGWNESPPHQAHAVVWRWWETHYGAEIVGMADTRLEGWVAAPPSTPTMMARLAWEMEHYCPAYAEQIPDPKLLAELRVWRFAWH